VIERYVRRDRPVVLLPQAVGPFADAETAAYARKILTRADRVWVRDRCSLRHANDLVGTRASIGIAPDITLLDPGVPPSGPEADVVVVPNGRMVEQGGWGRAEYLAALAGAARAAETRGFSVAVMLHTREPADHHLGCELSEIVGCRSVHERDPRAAKGRLGAAQLVIGTRFHALLGALSQGVPAVAIGWSHKYDELFADFGIADLARAPRSAGATASLVDHALAVLPELRAKVESRLPELQAAVAAMWIECRTVLGVGGTAAVAATTAT
jgi:colanic acid/amylovoran biosynthesis protein